MKEGDELQRREITSTERFSMGPNRYTEASLVHKLEELGIGRPSTYAPTISTIQQREYVQKGDKSGKEREYAIDTLKGIKITSKQKKEMAGNEKGKLLPTDIGIVVNDFLMENFPDIMDYNFTANVEKEFDRIADGDITVKAGDTEGTNWVSQGEKEDVKDTDTVITGESDKNTVTIDTSEGNVDVTFDDAVRYRQAIEAARPLTSDFRILGEYAECPNPVI